MIKLTASQIERLNDCLSTDLKAILDEIKSKTVVKGDHDKDAYEKLEQQAIKFLNLTHEFKRYIEEYLKEGLDAGEMDMNKYQIEQMEQNDGSENKKDIMNMQKKSEKDLLGQTSLIGDQNKVNSELIQFHLL